MSSVAEIRSYHQNLFAEKDSVFLDLETNGLEVTTDILEIGAIKYKAGQLGAGNLEPAEIFHAYIYFDGVPNMGAFEVNQLNPITLRTEGKQLAKVLADLREFTRGTTVAGQNIIRFDMPIIGYRCKMHDITLEHGELVDTLHLAKDIVRLPSYRLADLARYFGMNYRPTHRAVDDVRATAELFTKLIYPRAAGQLL